MRTEMIAATLVASIATRTTAGGLPPQWQHAFTLLFSSGSLETGLFNLATLAAYPLARWLLAQAFGGPCNG